MAHLGSGLYGIVGRVATCLVLSQAAQHLHGQPKEKMRIYTVFPHGYIKEDEKGIAKQARKGAKITAPQYHGPNPYSCYIHSFKE